MYEGWVDCEFITFGKNVKVGQGSFIISNIIIKNKLILKRVFIDDNVIIGAHSIVLPGTIIEFNTILDAISMTSINQRLDSNSVYRGNPAKKMEGAITINSSDQFKNLVFDKKIMEEYDKESLRSHAKEMSVPFHFYIITGWIIIGGSFILPGFIFFFFLFIILIPNIFSIPLSLFLFSEPLIITLLILTPIIFVSIYLLHLFFVALFTKWFYRYGR